MPPTVNSDQSVSFDIDPSNPGNDITINLTLLDNARWQGNRPDVVASLAFGGNNALHVVYETFDGTFAYVPSVDISIEFHYTGGVYLEDLQLGDVEAMSGGRREETVRNFVGTPATPGPNVNATITKPVTSTNVDVFDSGLATARAVGTGFASDSNPVTAPTANVFVSFPDPVTEIEFNWGRADTRDINGNQGIFIGNITFTPAIPEAEVYWGGALLLAFAGWHFWRKRQAKLQADS